MRVLTILSIACTTTSFDIRGGLLYERIYDYSCIINIHVDYCLILIRVGIGLFNNLFPIRLHDFGNPILPTFDSLSHMNIKSNPSTFLSRLNLSNIVSRLILEMNERTTVDWWLSPTYPTPIAANVVLQPRSIVNSGSDLRP